MHKGQGKKGSVLVVRLRSPVTDLNGLPNYVIGDVFTIPGWHEIELTIAPMSLKVLVDGEETPTIDLPDNTLTDWSSSYRLLWGHELQCRRVWC